MNIEHHSIANLHRKDTALTEPTNDRQSTSEIKENLGEMETEQSARPQEAEAVFI